MHKIDDRPYFVKGNISLPRVSIANPITSLQCVFPSHEDAFYFRLLESKGIFLNRQQVDAVRATEGPVLINSIPGSGKSTVITCKIGYLISVKNIKPENILAITFTRKAAQSLNYMLKNLTIPGSECVLATTFHSLCLKIMKLSGLKKFNILSSDKQKEYILKSILKKLKLEDDHYVDRMLNLISYIKTSLVVSTDSMERSLTSQEFNIYTNYEEYKKANNLLDFDDLLYNGWRTLNTSSYILGLLQSQFTFITIDEYQDLCPIEHDIVRMLAGTLNNICAVGDPAQNIFSFRGSDSKYISDFAKEYKNARILTLNVNYRSTAPIIALSDNILKYVGIDRNSYAVKDNSIHPMYINASDSLDEAKIITEKIAEMIRKNRVLPKDICILFRSSSANVFIVEELTINNLPFVEYSTKELLYADAVVKPLIAYLRLSINPDDLSALSDVLGTMYLNKTQTLSWLNMDDNSSKPLFETIMFMPNLKDYHYEILSGRECTINGIKNLKPLASIRKLRSDFYDRYLKINDSSTASISKESMVDMLKELEESASRFRTIPEFIEYIDLLTQKYEETKTNMSEENINAISLMSMHRSKGLQFPVVFILSVVENVIPHKRVMDEAVLSNSRLNKSTLSELLDEECRLLYVAVTRAERELYISIPRQCHDYPSEASRFLRGAFSIATTNQI
jgi:DNA helicase-2/ATP-dependent DNA helicase PcrA